MKTSLLVLILGFSLPAYAQNLSLEPYAGYSGDFAFNSQMAGGKVTGTLNGYNLGLNLVVPLITSKCADFVVEGNVDYSDTKGIVMLQSPINKGLYAIGATFNTLSINVSPGVRFHLSKSLDLTVLGQIGKSLSDSLSYDTNTDVESSGYGYLPTVGNHYNYGGNLKLDYSITGKVKLGVQETLTVNTMTVNFGGLSGAYGSNDQASYVNSSTDLVASVQF